MNGNIANTTGGNSRAYGTEFKRIDEAVIGLGS